MLRRYLGLVRKEIKIAQRNYFFTIVLGVALLFVGLTNYLLPEEVSFKPAVYFLLEYEGEMKPIFAELLEEIKSKHGKVYGVNSVQEITASLDKNFNSLGMIIKGEDEKPHIEFILQGYENKKAVNTLILAVKDELRNKLQGNTAVELVFLRRERKEENISFRHNLVPIFIVMESILLGFFLIAALIFMEKDEGTIRAYQVSPATIGEYLAAKITLMLLLGSISAVVLLVPTLGAAVNYIPALTFVALGSIAAAILGLVVASFFTNISQASVWLIGISILLSLPFLSYYYPSFAPTSIKLIPTYPLLFTAKEILFPSGSRRLVYTTLLGLVAFNMLGFTLAMVAYGSKGRGEGQ